jgi:DNA (cytosine-5)-methyltransferase 1
MIKVLDVCSGIGGFSLGLEATGGFDTVAFCENDEFCRKVLNKHWPNVPIYEDLKEIGNEPTRLIQEFDLICGGIPCQPFSFAGKKKGKEDDRHLWPYMYEIIKRKKPTLVIVENVGGFVNVALDDVCLDLETEGYATQSFIIPACGVEAPHRRDRVWIIGKITKNDANTNSERSHREEVNKQREIESNDRQKRESRSVREVLAYKGDTEIWATNDMECANSSSDGYAEPSLGRVVDGLSSRLDGHQGFRVEPNIPRIAENIPDRVNRLKALGNSIVPQIIYHIGMAILEEERKNKNSA